MLRPIWDYDIKKSAISRYYIADFVAPTGIEPVYHA